MQVTSLPREIGADLVRAIEAEGVPVIFLRGEGRVAADGARDCDLLVPIAAEPIVRDRWAAMIQAAECLADAHHAALAAAVAAADGEPLGTAGTAAADGEGLASVAGRRADA